MRSTSLTHCQLRHASKFDFFCKKDDAKDDVKPVEKVPCDVCGVMVPFHSYCAHVAKHDPTLAAATNVRYVSGEAEGTSLFCEVCSAHVFHADYDAHMEFHEQEASRRPIEDLSASTQPDIIALQAIEFTRGAEELLPCEVSNFDTCARFVRKLQEFVQQYGADIGSAMEVVYHWTDPSNIHVIVENSLLVPGESNADGSCVHVANGSRYGTGIYAADNLSFGRTYGRGAQYALLCIALPGCEAMLTERAELQPGQDSLKHNQLRVYRTSEQLMPLFLVNTDNERDTQHMAEIVIDFLKNRLNQ